MKYQPLLLVFIITLLAVTHSCSDATSDYQADGSSTGGTTSNCTSNTATGYWKGSIDQIMSNSCVSCHSSYSSYTSVKAEITAIVNSVTKGTMPKSPKTISETDKALLKTWANSGMPETKC
jgi:hypothetical protein